MNALPGDGRFQEAVGSLEPGWVQALQRLAGNAVVASLIQRWVVPQRSSVEILQRCGAHECQGSCAEDGEAYTSTQRAPDAPTSAAPPVKQPVEEKPKPLCDFDRLRKTIPSKGDTDPAPNPKDPIADADVAWVDDIKPPHLAQWLVPQIDLPFTVGVFDAYAATWVAKCEAPAREKVKWIKDPAKKKAAEETLKKQLELDQKELAKVHAEYVSKTSTGRLNYRKAFLHTMRCLLGPDPATKTHFSALDEVAPGLWLAADAAPRLRLVQKVLKDHGQELPTTDQGQGLRGSHLEKHQTGWWGHALGFSVDFLPYENPHITEKRTTRLVRMLTGEAERLRFTDDKGNELEWGTRRSIIKGIGEKTAVGEDPTTDPKFSRLLTQVDEQYLRMSEGSRKLQEDTAVLPAENRRQLDKLKRDYIGLYEQIVDASKDVDKQKNTLEGAKKAVRNKLIKAAAAAKRASPKIDDKTVEADPDVAPLVQKLAEAMKKKEDLEARRKALKDRLPKIFAPWLERIKKEFLDLDAIAMKDGVVAARLPQIDDDRFEYIEARLDKMAARESQIPADKWPADVQLKTMRGSIAKDLAKITDAFADQAAVATKRSSTEILEEVRRVRRLVLRRNDRPLMQQLYDSLSADLTYVLGVVVPVPSWKRKPGGDRYWLKPGLGIGEVVPVAQLLEKPGERNANQRVGGLIQHSQLLVKTMVQYGWDPGASWKDWVDTMHFDFVKGFDRVKITGYEACSPSGKSSH